MSLVIQAGEYAAGGEFRSRYKQVKILDLAERLIYLSKKYGHDSRRNPNSRGWIKTWRKII